jgi:hypothetical protein
MKTTKTPRLEVRLGLASRLCRECPRWRSAAPARQFFDWLALPQRTPQRAFTTEGVCHRGRSLQIAEQLPHPSVSHFAICNLQFAFFILPSAWPIGPCLIAKCRKCESAMGTGRRCSMDESWQISNVPSRNRVASNPKPVVLYCVFHVKQATRVEFTFHVKRARSTADGTRRSPATFQTGISW